MFHMNRWILQDRNTSIVKRLPYFKSTLLAVACFALGYRAIYNRHLESLDSHFRRFCRSIVERIANSHAAKYFINRIFRCAYSLTKPNIKPWSCICCLSPRRFANIFPHYRKKLGSTYFTMVPHWNISNWPPLGNRNFKHTAGTKAWDYESHLGSTLRIFHRILLQVG